MSDDLPSTFDADDELPERVGKCCSCIYEKHKLYIPDDESEPVQLLCVVCDDCAGWDE